MKELPIRFLLSLCFILLCGYSEGLDLATSRPATPIWAWQPSDAAPACVEEHGEEDFWRLTYSAERERAFDCKIDVAEVKEGEEEEHDSLFTGQLKCGGSPTPISSLHPSWFEIFCSGSELVHTASYITSRRYLMFRVFRI